MAPHSQTKKNIELIDEVDAFPYQDTDPNGYAQAMEAFYTLIWRDEEGDVPLGYVPKGVLTALMQAPADVRGDVQFDSDKGTILAFTQPTEEERSRQIAVLTSYWRARRTFKILDGWRDELWPVYGRRGELLYNIERAAVGLFGAMRYGVHMTAFVRSNAAPHGIKIWVPKRAASKSSWPGRLDNTVAGGLMTGEDPFESIVREADEEASLTEAVIRAGARLIGEVTYVYVTTEQAGGETGLIYPECQWVYDLELGDDIIPQPKDGEVEAFALCDVDQVRAQLAEGRFKPNCALIVIDFFIRHGILTRNNEPDYDEINRRIRRVLPFPGPHKHSVFSTSTS